MADAFGSNTITNQLAKFLLTTVQDPIGITAASVPGASMLNGHIGGAQQAPAVTPAAKAAYIAEDNTPGIKNVGGAMAWKTATGLWT